MNEVVQTATDDNPESWSDQWIRAELARLYAARGDNTERLARVYVAAVGRGLCELDPFDRWLHMVAKGTLRGGMVDRLHHRPDSLTAVSKLTLSDQDRVLAGERFPVVCGRDTRNLTVFGMDPGQPRQVFYNGRILSVDEQRKAMGIIERKATRTPDSEPEPDLRRYTPTLNREKGQLEVGRMSFPLKGVLAALASTTPDRPPPLDLRGEELDMAGCEVVAAVMWKEEAGELRKASTRTGLPTSELIRKAIRAYLGSVLDGE